MKTASEEYITQEQSTERKPAEIYHIWRDGGEHWYYTSGDITIIYDSNDYVPAALKRSIVRYNKELDVSILDITSSHAQTPMIEFIANNPVEVLWVQVSKLYRDQSPLEISVIFIGQIKSVAFKGVAAEINCVGFEHFLKMPIPVMRFQTICNHKIYDTKCTKAKIDYLTSTAITLDSTETVLTSTDFGAKADGYFTGGFVVFGDEDRAVVFHVGDDITIQSKMKNLIDTDIVSAYPGCAGTVRICRDKFDNVVNFLGFPYIPKDNPAQRTSL